MTQRSDGRQGNPDISPDSSSASSPAAPLTVAAVARAVGVAPTTLRTWARRHRLGPTDHQAGEHRRYSPEDVGRLLLMRRLTLSGVPAGEAAHIARAADPAHLPAPDGRGADPSLDRAAPAPSRTRAVRGLVRAAQAMDAPAATSLVAGALTRRGVVPCWESLCVPALVTVGEDWARTGTGVDVEHLLAECIMAALHQHADGLPATGRPVLLACAEEEQHSLPLHAVAAALAERRVATRLLGGRVPRAALYTAERRTAPAAVLLWSQIQETGDLAQVDTLLDRILKAGRIPPVVALGGPGWSRSALARRAGNGVLAVDDLPEAVVALAGATG